MCIFCERAKAEVEGLPVVGFGDWTTTTAEKREVEQCATLRQQRIPATIFTGFLGSGKTTTLNYLLQQPHGKRLAVIENEAGEVSIDDGLLLLQDLSLTTEVVLMPNGCLCCRVRGDLVNALKSIIQKGLIPSLPSSSSPITPLLDGIILELSGLAEVGPVVQTFFADPYVQAHVQLDAIICVADAVYLADALNSSTNRSSNDSSSSSSSSSSSHHDESSSDGRGSDSDSDAEEHTKRLKVVMEQVCLADRVLLNKIDLLSSGTTTVEGIKGVIKRVNPDVRILECVRGMVPVEELMGLDSFSLERALAIDHHFEEGISSSSSSSSSSSHHQHKSDMVEGASKPPHHHHDSLGFTTVGIEVKEGPLEWEAMKKWLKDVLTTQGRDVIYRFKGG